MIYRDRRDGGRRLAARLERYRDMQPVILGLPRGGVITAYEVAKALDAPLDVLIVRKLGAPGAEELAIGAITADTALVNEPLVAQLRIPRDRLATVLGRERLELARREELYHRDCPAIEVKGRTVILVDDGVATGSTALAAIESLRHRGPARIVFAAPVCSDEAAAALAGAADEVVCLECPADFGAVGYWYEEFEPTSDAEVLGCLRAANDRRVLV